MSANSQPVIDAIQGAVGLYSLQEAAYYARIPENTLRYWFLGRGDYQPVRTPSVDREGIPYLSFQDFIESLAIRFLRVEKKVQMKEIRDSILRAQDEHGIEYPFSDRRHKLAIDKVDRSLHIYINREGDPFKLAGSNIGQRGIQKILEPYMNDLLFDDEDFLARQYRAYTSGGRNVIMNPRFLFGQPKVENSPYSARALWESYIAEGGIDYVCDYYDVSRSVVELSCEYCQHVGIAA
ncbi:hypothetical protein DDZ13_06490 [Coraliomargarita sinensis]|uniref:Uncharacterized protein n=1 Tax=Coraliomargarita sinensis TaxID=2174842 RepID=A0A317ZLJ2_9BACT|nr:hypothetical protein [Coraliomargarita sinensis]PXA04808.1 hypothetical protein DDZ13_06490 [Coraliomargarita sinensis]